MKQAAIFLIIMLVAACSEKKQANKADIRNSYSRPMNAIAKPLPVRRSILLDSIANGSTEEANYLAYILNESTYHGDEVTDDMADKPWYGLFKSKTGYYLKKCALLFNRVNDAVLDSDNQKTGWEINVSEKDTSVILIGGLDYLMNRNVPHSTLKISKIWPGDTVRFTLLGRAYMLYATGKKIKESETSDNYTTIDYELNLANIVDGVTVRQSLVKASSFDDAMMSILFVGDIDGDNKVDLLIDTTNHYNASIPTLYLSKPAEKGKLVKIVAEQQSVGC